MRSILKSKASICLTVAILLFFVPIVIAALSNSYDTAVPSGSANPRDTDDFIRSFKAAVQERMNDHNTGTDEGDHYWPITGTDVDDVDTGQHRMVTIRQMAGNPSALASYTTITDLGFAFQKDVSGNGELFWQDEAANVLQITNAGDLHSSENFTMLTDKTATIETIIAVDGTGLVLQNDTPATVITIEDSGIATLADASTLATDAAPSAGSAEIANAKYVDDSVSALAFGVFTAQDDDPTDMLKAHAYLANQDGFVTAFVVCDGAGNFLSGFVGSSDNPAGAGTLVNKDLANATAEILNLTFPVQSGKYFELTTDSGNGVTIIWHPVGTLIAPTDQD